MNTVHHQPYHERRRSAACVRWKRAAELRAQGYTYATIGTMLNVSLAMAFKIVTKHESHMLK